MYGTPIDGETHLRRDYALVKNQTGYLKAQLALPALTGPVLGE